MTLLSAIAAVEEVTFDRHALGSGSDLTAVERFAQRDEAELVPRQARYYRDLMPAAPPQPGHQYAFDVDLDACTGCKACVVACHSLNGLAEGESWRSVKLLTGGTSARPVQQLVTAACHHCVDPACLAGCPVDAYEKDAVTGVVAHLDDQCIGCGYCTLTCPYEVPVFNEARGIVRKCDMCQDRLSAGEAPACVQACPNEAIAITVVETSASSSAARAGVTVPAGPPSSISTPTTIYRTTNDDVRTLAAEPGISTGPAHPHAPLAVMLVLTQLAVGAFVTDVLFRAASGRNGAGPPRVLDAAIALSAATLAIGASVLHLGRPRYFYRAVIGWRHSWLSREVIAFGAFTTLAGAYAVEVATRLSVGTPVEAALATVALSAGVVGVACSVLIYTTTHRSSWRLPSVSARFTFTAAGCGLSAVTWASLLSGTPEPRSLPALSAGVLAAKLLGDATVLWPSNVPERKRRARLMVGDLRAVTVVRFAAGTAGGIVVPAVLVALAGSTSWISVALATVGLAAVVAGELAERSLFFTTASPPR